MQGSLFPVVKAFVGFAISGVQAAFFYYFPENLADVVLLYVREIIVVVVVFLVEYVAVCSLYLDCTFGLGGISLLIPFRTRSCRRKFRMLPTGFEPVFWG